MTKRRRILIMLVVLSGVAAFALGQVGVQRVGILDFTGLTSAPTNPPTNLGRVYYDSSAKLLKCLNHDGTSCASGGGGSGTVTSVSFTGGLISVATPTTTPAFTVAGTSGGIPYFSSTSTWASSGILNTNIVVLGGGAGGAPTNSSITDNGSAVSTSETVASGGFLNQTATATEQYTQFGRAGVGIPVPYFTPTASSVTSSIAWDLFPHGTPADFSANTGAAWDDICSTDINGVNSANYECLRLGKFTSGTQSGAAHVSAAKGGSGTVRSLILQLNGGSVGIGALPASGALLSGTGDTAFTQYCDAGHANCFTPASVASMPAQQPLGSGAGTCCGVGLSAAGATSAEGFIALGSGSYLHAIIAVTTPDNSTNTYNFGIYNAAGTLLCSTGAMAGSTFAAATGSKTITFTGSCTLVQNQIYFFAYSSITANTIRLTGLSGSSSSPGDTLSPFVSAQVSASSMPGSITAPTIAYAATLGVGAWFGLVP